MVYGEFSVKSSKTVQAVDVTAEVQNELAKIGIENGIAIVFVPHTSCGLVVNEFEPALAADLEKFFSSFAKGNWAHDGAGDGNAQAHLANSALGASKQFIVEKGRLVLGQWQSVILLELDGPRQRRVLVKCIKG